MAAERVCLEEAEERNLSVHREGVLVGREVKKRTRRERVKTGTSQRVGGGKGKTGRRRGKVGKRVRKKSRFCLWVNTVAVEELTR